MPNAIARAIGGGGKMVYPIFSPTLLLAIGAIYAGANGGLYLRQGSPPFEPDPPPAREPRFHAPDHLQ